ncbi:TetR/AcrR family transcriptional regulator [Longispora albida]|uniref:TetR/AcrR family transcriptional regulator n=1 Tax=Longispora albida TaxID=203523 RepID=UPI00036D31C6|nr:TetR/AcrR family transcriptional regulator [Longispora albida]
MTRDRLLDAAESLLAEQGTGAFTLAKVAEHAGVSKGGLLYHFNSKEALVTALIERLISEFDARIAAHDTGCYARAYLEATFEVVTGDPAGTGRRWAVATAAATDTGISAPLREAFRRWHAEDNDADAVTSQLVRAAAEGIWEVCVMAPGAYSPERLAELRERLLTLL